MFNKFNTLIYNKILFISKALKPLSLLLNVGYLGRNIPVNCITCWQQGQKGWAFIRTVLFGGGNVSCPDNMNINWIA
ncbi:hypothetical protein UB33_02395 [Photobacterium angustum]|nr:hypothetical protein UB33_02395 [Photobacterium angustum]